MKALELIEIIEKFAPLNYAAPWDKSGIQVASFKETITRIAVMLDPGPRSIAKALDTGADFLVAHHPLLMKPRFTDKADDYLRVLGMVLGANAWLYSSHTSLDANPEGPARWLGEELGLMGMETLAHAGDGFGFGFVGNLPLPLSYEDFSRTVARVVGVEKWRGCGLVPKHVCRVACCPGSGSDLAVLAALSGADVLVTGDCKYHAAMEAPLRLLDVGHFALEEEMMRRVTTILQEITGLDALFIPAIDPFSFESL